MRSNAAQSHGAEEDYPEPEANGKMTKGPAEEELPASVVQRANTQSLANYVQDVNHVGRKRRSARGSSRALIARGSVNMIFALDRNIL
jgi:hypothetical protein